MLIQFEHDHHIVKIDSEIFHDISLAVKKQNNVNCYHLDEPIFSYFESPEFSGNLSAGGSVNCEKISLYPHASGTHTECALHVTAADFDMRHVQIPVFMMASLYSVNPEKQGDDLLISMQAVSGILNIKQFDAIIIRCLPNPESKRVANYSGNNPIYFHPEVILHFKALGYKHLICDIPSIDKEMDNGRLEGHKNWFVTDGIASAKQTITELVYIADHILDGDYAINMQVPSIESDAVPSRILIYPCV